MTECDLGKVGVFIEKLENLHPGSLLLLIGSISFQIDRGNEVQGDLVTELQRQFFDDLTDWERANALFRAAAKMRDICSAAGEHYKQKALRKN